LGVQASSDAIGRAVPRPRFDEAVVASDIEVAIDIG
jgi:hypothetical protein